MSVTNLQLNIHHKNIPFKLSIFKIKRVEKLETNFPGRRKKNPGQYVYFLGHRMI